MGNKISYCVITKFKWHDPIASAIYYDFPKLNQVYRVLNDKLLIRHVSPNKETVDASLLSEMMGPGNNIVNLSAKTIVSLNLPESELDKLISWIDNNNEDIPEISLVNNTNATYTPGTEPATKNPIEESKIAELIRSVFSGDFDQQIEHLKLTNTLQFEAIFELVEHLNDMNSNEFDPAEDILLSEHGRAVNIADAMRSISNYHHTEDRNSLLDAIASLIRELERRNYLNI